MKNYTLSDEQMKKMKHAYEEIKKFDPPMLGLPETLEDFVHSWMDAKVNLALDNARAYHHKIVTAKKFILQVKEELEADAKIMYEEGYKTSPEVEEIIH